MQFKLTKLQKLRLLQAFFSLLFFVISFTFMSSYNLPKPPGIENFYSEWNVIKYNIYQFVFLISFICAAGFLGMAYQAKDIDAGE